MRKSRSWYWVFAALAMMTAPNLSRGETVAPGQGGCKSLLAETDFAMTVVSARLLPAADGTPEHCRVRGVIPEAVQFEVNLPTTWNEKFYMVGNGGYWGMIFDQGYGLDRGYATASTDTGHQGPSPAFAHDNPGAEIDFAFRAIHLTVLAAKRLIAAYYGTAPRLSYYRGCSTGGRQGLMEMQRFPDEFDGMSIGAPIYDYSLKQTFNATWAAQAFFSNDRAGHVPIRKLKALGKAVYARCDGIDGLADGLIDDPRKCDFVASRDLQRCPSGADRDDCFQAAQIEAIAKIYAGPGKGRYPGHIKGAEWMPHEGPGFSGGWDLYFSGRVAPTKAEREASGGLARDAYGGDNFLPVQYRNAMSFWNFFAFETDRPGFDAIADIDFDDLPDASHAAGLYDATDSDLAPFAGHGGKIILWHGWADVGLNPLATLKYYQAVGKTMGVKAREDFMKLFLVPGMYHCAGGPGPDVFDDLTALEGWVESDVAPQRMTAAKYRDTGIFGSGRGPGGTELPLEGGQTIRTRPICAYPKVARYKGVGSIDEAENFACRAP